jgi:hypothetical protein
MNDMNQKLVELQRQVSAKRIIVDGSILSGLIGTLVLAAMFYNAEIFHDDYPPDIQEKAAPMSLQAKRQRRIVALILFLLLLGMPTYSNLKLKRQNHGQLPFLVAWLNAYAVSAIFNLFDLLVIDYLVVIGLHPEFVVLPGTEGMASYHDFFFPFVGFLKGLGFGLVPSLLIAFFTSRQWTKELDHDQVT